MVYLINILLRDKKFWIASVSIWGLVWSVFEGVLFSLQLMGVVPNPALGIWVIFFAVISILIGGYLNWPLRQLTCKIGNAGVNVRLKFGDFWAESGEKIIAVTRCFSANVDDVVIHSGSLHGGFIRRNFANNQEAKIRFDSELGRSPGDEMVYDVGKTIKIDGKKDTAFLVGMTKLDANNRATMEPNDYFIAIGNMWEFIKQRNGNTRLVCPLLGAGRARLNFDSVAIFCELLNSALTSMKTGFITRDLVFIVSRNDVLNELVDLGEIKQTFRTLCSYENLKRISIAGAAMEVS